MSYIEWGVLGLLLVLLELFIPGIYLVWFGLAGVTVSLALHFAWIPDTITAQLVLFSVCSCVFTGLGLTVYKMLEKRFEKTTDHKNLNDLAGAYVGQTATLTQDVVDGKTKVKVADTVWLAQCDDDLKKGDKVVITGVIKGLIFVVKKA